jgi:hypothetical protein
MLLFGMAEATFILIDDASAAMKNSVLLASDFDYGFL